jgi:L-rhamnose mutarotase
MKKESNPMDKFQFLLGTWRMDYKILKSRNILEDIGVGEGTFTSILNDRYVTFDYQVNLKTSQAAAHAIFAFDEDRKIYRYWWFEDSGKFMKAMGDFINKNKLMLIWEENQLVQTFHRLKNGNVILSMKNQSDINDHEIILEVLFTKMK